MIERVTWRDAWFDFDDSTDHGDYMVETVGWVSEEGRFLRIESEHIPDGARAVTRVPIECVANREPLVVAEHPSITALETA